MLGVKKETRERKPSLSARTSTEESASGASSTNHSGELAQSARSGTSSSGLPAGAVKGGWLLKQGGRWNNWKKRWVVLYPDALEFYQAKVTDKKKGDPKARVSLASMVEIDADVEGKKKNTFELQFSSRDSIFLDATSQKDKVAWIAALREQLKAQDADAEKTQVLIRRPSAAGSLRGRRLVQQRHAKEAEELEQKRSVMDLFPGDAPSKDEPVVAKKKAAPKDKAEKVEKHVEKEKPDIKSKVHGHGGGQARKSNTAGVSAASAQEKKEARALERRASLERIRDRYLQESRSLCDELERREMVLLSKRYAGAAEMIRAEIARRKK